MSTQDPKEIARQIVSEYMSSSRGWTEIIAAAIQQDREDRDKAHAEEVARLADIIEKLPSVMDPGASVKWKEAYHSAINDTLAVLRKKWMPQSLRAALEEPQEKTK